VRPSTSLTICAGGLLIAALVGAWFLATGTRDPPRVIVSGGSSPAIAEDVDAVAGSSKELTQTDDAVVGSLSGREPATVMAASPSAGWIVVRYPDAAPAAGLSVYTTGHESMYSRKIVEGASPKVGVVAVDGLLRRPAFTDDMTGLAIAYSDGAAVIVPAAAASDEAIIEIPRPCIQVVTLEAEGNPRQLPQDAFRLLVVSSGALLYSGLWDWSAMGQASFFSNYQLAGGDYQETEPFVMVVREVRLGDPSLRLIVPPSACEALVQACPFGWWVDGHKFQAGTGEVTLKARELRIHRLDLLDDSGAPLPNPAVVSVCMKQIGPSGNPILIAQMSLLTRDGPDHTDFTIPPAQDGVPVSILASYGDGKVLESEVFTVVPDRVVLQGAPHER
jgi:hypothetical protein